MNYPHSSHPQEQQYVDASSQNLQAPWQSLQPVPSYGVVNDPLSVLGQPDQQSSWDYVRQLEERVQYLENELSTVRSQLAMQSNPNYMVDHTPPQPSDVSYTTESQPADEGLSEPATESSIRRRKYVRKPRPDTNAPNKPLTAYSSFANDMRKQYQDRNLSFSDLAKQIGQGWQHCPSDKRDAYLSTAVEEKETYDALMSQYRNTDDYHKYQHYLAEFKNKMQGMSGTG